MKILVVAYAYSPSVGGIETVTRTLVREFVEDGHEVRVVTHTPGEEEPVEGIPVLRRPSRPKLWEAHRWCDVCMHSNISLTYAWPMLLRRKPWVIGVHGDTGIDLARPSLSARLKLFCLRRASRIAVSSHMEKVIGMKCTVIGNPLQAIPPQEPKERDGVVFLGRIVSEKGADFLLRALALIPAERRPNCTVIGEGPERAALESLAAGLGVEQSVRFAGVLQGDALWAELSKHVLIAVPSQYDEPFGVVALEGIACGCVVLASDRGGLPSAVGPCGLLLPSDDEGAWAEAIEHITTEENLCASMLAHAGAHLKQFTAKEVAGRYIEVLERACRKL